MRKLTSIAVLICFGLIGILTLFFGGRQLAEGLRARRWPVTDGTVIAAEVATVRNGSVPSFRPHITYTYRVAGVPYTSDRFGVLGGDSGSKREPVEKLVAAMAPGASVTVYYDATHPAAAMLQPGLGKLDWMVLVIGGGMAALSMGGLFSIKKYGVGRPDTVAVKARTLFSRTSKPGLSAPDLFVIQLEIEYRLRSTPEAVLQFLLEHGPEKEFVTMDQKPVVGEKIGKKIEVCAEVGAFPGNVLRGVILLRKIEEEKSVPPLALATLTLDVKEFEKR